MTTFAMLHIQAVSDADVTLTIAGLISRACPTFRSLQVSGMTGELSDPMPAFQAVIGLLCRVSAPERNVGQKMSRKNSCAGQ